MKTSSYHNIAYLVSEYPAASHTFIEREIEALRSENFKIQIASINTPKLLYAPLEGVYYIKQQGFFKALLYFFKRLLKAPLRTIKALGIIFKLSLKLPKRVFYFFGYTAEAFLLGDWLSQNKITHLHIHFANPAATVALFAKHLFQIEYSITVHGSDIFSNVLQNLLKEKIHDASFICCIGGYTKSQLMLHIPVSDWNKLLISPLGIDPQVYHPSIKEPTLNQTVQLLSVGRLDPAKGHHITIQAVDLLRKSGVEVHLSIIGDGPFRTSLEDEIVRHELQDFVSLKGAKPPKEVLKAYSETDIFVLASFAEGIPVVLMEAMALEIPCVTTFVNGIPELISHKEEGFLVTPSSPQELANQIIALINDPLLRARVGHQARIKVLEKYDLKQNTMHKKAIFLDRLHSI